MKKSKFSKAVSGILNGAVGMCEKAVKSPRFGMVLAMLCMVSVTFAQNSAGDYSAGTTALGTVTTEIAKYVPVAVKLCYAIAGVVAVVGAISVHQDEQRGAGCQEEHNDARGCLHLPDCSSPGSASVLRHRW